MKQHPTEQPHPIQGLAQPCCSGPLSETRSRNLKAITFLLVVNRGTRAIVADDATTTSLDPSREIVKKNNVMKHSTAGGDHKLEANLDASCGLFSRLSGREDMYFALLN